MSLKQRPSHHYYLFGCGLALLVILLGLGGLAALTLHRDRQAVQYPGAEHIFSRGVYHALPRHLLWVSRYHTADSVWTAYDWYARELSLMPLSLTNDGCVYLQGYKRWHYVTRSTNVTLCETPNGSRITVTRLTSVW